VGVSSSSVHEGWLQKFLNEYGYPNVISRYPTALMVGDVVSHSFDQGYASFIPANDGNPVASRKEKTEIAPKEHVQKYQ
jgi:hypothetical protein